MGELNYSGIMSLDGYTADTAGNFDWAAPDEEVHAFVNDLMRPAGTHLYGRRMYEVMAFWEDLPDYDEQPSLMKDFAELWKAADKIVYSRTLEAASTARTRIEREFDPEAIRELKSTVDTDLAIGGAELGGQAVKAGLVDVYQLFLSPIVVGGGKSYLPSDVRVNLELVEERSFGNGVVYLHYRAKR